ncbi:MAG TPA: PAS domain-containing sensor histidine kinase [Cyclobacteriaceae bacterium]|nr:PAS domain-containing sensor histidine kinase [Cyclobacteriaceae bacterium]
MRQKEAKYQFEAVFNHATIGMIIADSEGRITQFNRFAETQFGYSEEEVIGESIEMLLPVEMKERHIHHRDQFIKAPSNRAMGAGRDLFAKRKDNTVFPVEVSLSHFKKEEESFVIAFIIDISVRKKNEAELAESTEKIKIINTELEEKIDSRTKMLRETLAELEASKENLHKALKKERELGDLKSRFVTLASHEFRTPLSTILLSASLIGKYTLEEEDVKRQKHVDRIKEAVNNMRDILEDFLSLGKLEEGQVDVNMELLSNEELKEELYKVVNSMEQLRKDGQKINFECNADAVKVDKKLMASVLSNLLSNAIKFSPENSKIQLKCEMSNNVFRFMVKDAGIGISEEDQQHLFERFFRAQNASNIQGTGLGLNIVSKYLELMGGKIDCKSEINVGTTFYIEIPQ